MKRATVKLGVLIGWLIAACNGERTHVRVFGFRGSFRYTYVALLLRRRLDDDGFALVMKSISISIGLGLVTPCEALDDLALALKLIEKPYELNAEQIADHFDRKAQMINLLKVSS